MGSIRKVLSNVEYLVFVLTLIFVNSSRGAHLPFDARVNEVKVIFFPKIEENSIVPKLSVGSFSQVVLSGKNLEEGLRAVLTKRSGNEGKYCDSNSFVSPVYQLQSFKNFNNSVSMFLSAQSTNSLNDIKNVWVCLSTSNINENSQTLSKPKDYQWIHQGDASKIMVVKSNQNAGHKYDSTNVRSVVKTVSKRSISEYSLPEEAGRRNSSSKPVAWEGHSNPMAWEGHSSSTINQNRIPETLISTSEPKVETKERTSISNGLYSEFRTSVGISEISVPHLILSYQNYSTNYSRESNLISGLKPVLSSMKLHQAVNPRIRKGRDIKPTNTPSENSINFNSPLTNKLESSGNARVFGIRVESHSKGISYKDGAIELLADNDAEIRLFGSGLTPGISVQFTAMDEAFGGRCDASTSNVFPLENASGHWALINIRLPRMSTAQKVWYLCIREGTEGVAVHQGNEEWLTITTYSLLLPIWIQGIFLVFLLILSGLFSGLNLGLMALDKTELKIVMNTGTPTERKYAKSIEPVRRHGNFLLCTLLLGNVLVNSTLTILLDTLSSGLIAVIVSTIGIVIFGEIVPQAICSRHGLAIGAKTVWLVRMFMVITGIVSYPISKILDCVLGEEIGHTYDRERLKELIRVTQDRNDLQLEEQNIIYGALELHRKTVAEVMTKLDDVYMLNIDRSLDFHTINEIMQQGYSRVPIYENERTNIVSVLLIKDLAFIDPDDNTPLRTVTQFYQNACTFVFEDTTLDVIFKEFKQGNKGHMAFVQRVNNEGDCDPFYETVGLVTLEDVIEELIQEEIVDETDVFTDNKTKRRRKHIRKDFKEFSQNNQSTHRKVQISPQMQVAAFQYLRTSVEPFKEGHLSEGILKRMLNQDIIHVVKNESSKNDAQQPPNFIFVQGKPVDFFVLILEGHVEVTIGKENLTFESGPFTYFGLMALTTTPLGESPSLSTQLSRNSIVGSVQSLDATKFCFTPDYSVKGSTEVTFLKVKRSHYIAARRAFLLEQSQRDPLTDPLAEETFEKEMEKILRDESLTTPVWESSPDRDADAKDALLNGGAIVAKDEDQLELSIFADGRRHSLRETLMISRSPNSLHNPNGSVDNYADHIDRLSNGSSAAEEIGRGDQPTRKSEKNSPTVISI